MVAAGFAVPIQFVQELQRRVLLVQNHFRIVGKGRICLDFIQIVLNKTCGVVLKRDAAQPVGESVVDDAAARMAADEFKKPIRELVSDIIAHLIATVEDAAMAMGKDIGEKTKSHTRGAFRDDFRDVLIAPEIFLDWYATESEIAQGFGHGRSRVQNYRCPKISRNCGGAVGNRPDLKSIRAEVFGMPPLAIDSKSKFIFHSQAI